MPRRALLSVADKAGIVEFAGILAELDWELISTGGTAGVLRAAGLGVRDVSEVTGCGEMLDGRVKTLHPAIHAALLCRRSEQSHQEALSSQGYSPIDLVAVNLYPFTGAAGDPTLSEDQVLEQIDIGGASMLRAGAKNHASVTAICDPADYPLVAEELRTRNEVSPDTRRRLAARVFAHVSAYDADIANYLSRKRTGSLPVHYIISAPQIQALRYGENPHQRAAFYGHTVGAETSLVSSRQVQGKELSYNNLLDADAALEVVRDFAELAPAACVIIKHNNPCGIACATTGSEAYGRALETDPESAFGGIVALSVEITEEIARAMIQTFTEVILAPTATPAALDVFATKKNLRVLLTGAFTARRPQPMLRSVVGGLLVNERDLGMAKEESLHIVTEARPSGEDLSALLFAWHCAKWVKSNAIVFADAQSTIAIGAGQPSRIDAVRFGAQKARRSLAGSYLASDAFFPFRDSVDIAASHGVRAIIQPGGSVRDAEVVAACNEHGIPMVFTGMRHFRH